MRSTAPFAVSAAPAEAGHGMGAGAAYTVKTYTEGYDPFIPCEIEWRKTKGTVPAAVSAAVSAEAEDMV